MKDRKEQDSEYDLSEFKFLKEKIEITKTVKEAKRFELEIEFKNIGEKTYSGDDLYFEIGKDSSKEFYFPGIKKEKEQIFYIDRKLIPSSKIRDKLIFRSKEAKKENTYNIYLYICSSKTKKKISKPLNIIIHVIEVDDEEILLRTIYDSYENEFYISNYIIEDEFLEKIKELNYDNRLIYDWVSSFIMKN